MVSRKPAGVSMAATAPLVPPHQERSFRMKQRHTPPFACIAVAVIAACACLSSVHAAGAVDVAPAPPPAVRTVTTPDITVRVAVKRGIFKTSPVADMEVFLSHAPAGPEIESVRATGRLLARQIGDFRGLSSDLPFMKGRARAHVQQKRTTVADGTCSFAGVPPGEYVVFAGYVDDTGVGYWLVPVTVAVGAPQQLALTTKNMHEFFKKK
jgi:hypothetical protein